MHNDIAEVLFTEDEIARRVGEIGRAITSERWITWLSHRMAMVQKARELYAF